MIKFIVLTRSRTGSNLLVSMLNSHPDVRCGGEELRSLNGRQVSEAIETSFPIRQALKASGFKIFYYHPLDDSSGAVRDTLSAMRELRVLHLMRRNILRTLTSRKIATQTNVWHSRTQTTVAADDKRVFFTEDELQSGFIQTKQWENEYASRFDESRTLQVYYEDLVGNYDGQFRRIASFLEVEPHQPRTDLKRQNPEPLDKLIVNYDALKEHFANTEWAVYFDA